LSSAAAPGRPERQVDGGGGVVLTADERLDLAVPIDRHQRPRGLARRRVEGVGVLTVHGLVGLGLEGGVERGGNPKSAAVDDLLAVFGVELLADGFDEVGVPGARGAHQPARRRGRVDVLGKRGGFHGLGLGGADLLVAHHGLECVGLVLAGQRRVTGRVGRVGLADEAGQERRLGQVQLADVATEIGAGGRFDSVGAPTPVDRVQIALENLVFGFGSRQADGERRLFDLSGHGPLRGQIGLLDVLLGDGGGALDVAGPAQIGKKCSDDAHRVEGAFCEEMAVLGRHDRVDHDRRYLFQGDVDPVLLRERGEHMLPRSVVYEGGLLEGLGCGQRDPRQGEQAEGRRA
jgi:hypothetical protein